MVVRTVTRFLHFVTRVEFLIPCALFLLSACGGKQTPQQHASEQYSHSQFRLHLDSTQTVFDSLAVDLNQDGVMECVFTVGSKPELGNPGRLFNVIHVFELQPDSSWESIFTDAVESGEKIEFRDITGSGLPEIIAYLNSGGNDPVNARGMHVYGFRADEAFTLLFYSSNGDPVFKDLNSDGVREILLSGEYWGQATRSESFLYTSEIYSFDGMVYKPENARFASYFDTEINRLSALYQIARKNVQKTKDPLELYRRAMMLMLWTAARSGSDGVSQFWRTEKTVLRPLLPEELFDELEYFVETEQEGFTKHRTQHPI